LLNGKFRLNDLSSQDILTEMEFYFENEEILGSRLLSIIRGNSAPAPGLSNITESGYLKGFVDLIFRYNGKYYILDYKTNFLGDEVSDYGQPALNNEMREALYDLQAHIYTIALHRYLTDKVPDYSYKTHFGGYFYLFIRGINENGSEGIYYDQPDQRVVDELNNYIGGSHA